MKNIINKRINTQFSNAAYQWLVEEAGTQGASLSQVVREKVEQARKEDEILSRVEYLEKVIKKSHAIIVERLGGVK